MTDQALHFDADWEERATLRDGSEVLVRLIQPRDKPLLREGFERLSPESRYRRFFSHKTRLTDHELAYLTELDQDRHLAIGASCRAPDGHEQGLGVARYVRLPEQPHTAEAAIAVVDDAQGKGIGGLLFARLVAAARERGIERFRSEVLGDNEPMQQFLLGLDPDAKLHYESGVAIIELELPEIGATHPAARPPRETPMYDLLRLTARGRVTVPPGMAKPKPEG
jgi:GNAT superfamily N-acetyltransferase